MSELEKQIVETWAIHNRVNLYLLDAIDPESLKLSLKEKGRTVAALFAHMHNVRLMWLKPTAPELLSTAGEKCDTESTQSQLAKSLIASGDAIESLLRKSAESGGKAKSFKRGVVPFLGYLISHESHHRGQIGWILKHTGHAAARASHSAFGIGMQFKKSVVRFNIPPPCSSDVQTIRGGTGRRGFVQRDSFDRLLLEHLPAAAVLRFA